MVSGYSPMVPTLGILSVAGSALVIAIALTGSSIITILKRRRGVTNG